MVDDEDGAGETAISYTNQFLDAAIAKLDGRFGAGFAKENPALIAAYISACSANLAGFMQSALAVASMSEPDIFSDMLEGLNELEGLDEKPRKKRKQR
ncbi:MAG: hypothetical protein ACKVS5_05860 [Parvularculaceae bacterium]